jgi:transposase-like protein
MKATTHGYDQPGTIRRSRSRIDEEHSFTPPPSISQAHNAKAESLRNKLSAALVTEKVAHSKLVAYAAEHKAALDKRMAAEEELNSHLAKANMAKHQFVSVPAGTPRKA